MEREPERQTDEMEKRTDELQREIDEARKRAEETPGVDVDEEPPAQPESP